MQSYGFFKRAKPGTSSRMDGRRPEGVPGQTPPEACFPKSTTWASRSTEAVMQLMGRWDNAVEDPRYILAAANGVFFRPTAP